MRRKSIRLLKIRSIMKMSTSGRRVVSELEQSLLSAGLVDVFNVIPKHW